MATVLWFQLAGSLNNSQRMRSDHTLTLFLYPGPRYFFKEAIENKILNLAPLKQKSEHTFQFTTVTLAVHSEVIY